MCAHESRAHGAVCHGETLEIQPPAVDGPGRTWTDLTGKSDELTVTGLSTWSLFWELQFL